MKKTELIPDSIRRFVSERAAQYPAIDRVLVYGSRARGDARERSDFDLAVEAPQIPQSEWSRFVLELKEDIPTLCGVDLLLLTKKTSPDLRANVQEEGTVIYERAA